MDTPACFFRPFDYEIVCQHRHVYPAKLSINIDGETKIFQEKNKFTHFISTNQALKRIVGGKLQHKEGNYTLEKARK